MTDIREKALHFDTKDFRKREANEVTAILTRMGWCRDGKDKANRTRWRPEGSVSTLREKDQ